MSTLRGSKERCGRCDMAHACVQRGIYFLCPRCLCISDIALKAQSGSVLVLKGERLEEFRTGILMDYIDGRLHRLETESSTVSQEPTR